MEPDEQQGGGGDKSELGRAGSAASQELSTYGAKQLRVLPVLLSVLTLLSCREGDAPSTANRPAAVKDSSVAELKGPPSETVQDPREQANVYLDLGNLERKRNNYNAARAAYGKALPLYEVVQDRLGQAHVYRGLGHLERAMNNPDAARAAYKKALLLYEAVQSPTGKKAVRAALASLKE